MSAKQVSLKSPVTIVVVVVLLAAVAVFNIQTFGNKSGSNKANGGYRVQAHPAVPGDVHSLVNREVSLAIGEDKSGKNEKREALHRDPFHPNQKRSVVSHQSVGKSKPRTVAKRNTVRPMTCSAIMLGGKRSMAILDGKGQYLGDKIRGMTITGIDADGVTFKNSKGAATYLAVGVQEDKDPSFRVVSGVINTNAHGRTRLVDK